MVTTPAVIVQMLESNPGQMYVDPYGKVMYALADGILLIFTGEDFGAMSVSEANAYLVKSLSEVS